MQDRPPFVMHVVYNECCYVLRAGEGGKYMAQINVNNLTFAYEGSFDNVFENTSFSIDTNWRLGFVGRNGKGKTTFLNLLLFQSVLFQANQSILNLFLLILPPEI